MTTPAFTPGTAATSDVAETMVLPPAPADLSPGTRFGQYRILGLLGEGGMGQVYQAVQGTLERLVALKVMRPELANDAQFSERFLREARAAASVCHHHVVIIFDAGCQDGRLYMAFQFVTGGDLDAELARRRSYAASEALALIAGCCEGLHAIHEAGLVHRDIKPHNIFLDAQGRPKLGDFGLARQAHGADRMTMTGVGMGTPAFMAPEQAQGLADIDIRADIHALGGTLYTMLTGTPPFAGLTPWMVVNAVCNEPAPDPRALVPELPEAVAAITVRCLAKRREDRYQTPEELRRDVVRVRAALLGETSDVRGRSDLPTLTLPRMQMSGPHPFLRWGWLAVVATAATLALLPLGLVPLLDIHRRYHALSWVDSAWWAGWLTCLVIEAGLIWAVLDPHQRDRRTLAVTWLTSAVGAGVSAMLLFVALGAATDQRGGGWSLTANLIGWTSGLAWAGWLARRWWQRDPAMPLQAISRLLAGVAGVAIGALICHLIAADRTAPANANALSRSDNPLEWLTGHRDESTAIAPASHGTGAATALAITFSLNLMLLAPWLILRRREGTSPAN